MKSFRNWATQSKSKREHPSSRLQRMNRTLHCEALESRKLMATDAFMSCMGSDTSDVTGADSAVSGSSFIRGFGFNTSQSSTSSSSRVSLGATLTSTDIAGAIGSIRFQSSTQSDGTVLSLLTVQATGLAASTTYDITVGSTVVGTLTTDANGYGRTRISSGLPTDIAADTAVSVGSLTGTLASPTRPVATQAFQARLIDSTNSSFRATVKAKASTTDSTTTNLTVSVVGATASSSLEVKIGDTVVGSITTDANGSGQTQILGVASTVAADTAVSVGTLSGTFSAVSNNGHRGFGGGRFGRHGGR